MRQLTLVAHCWRYSRALTYFLSSLIVHKPSKVNIVATVFHSPDDAPTVNVLRYFGDLLPTGLDQANVEKILKYYAVVLNPWPLPLPELLNRTIGRNKAALTTKGDVVWFIDCDYWLGAGCVDFFEDLDLTKSKLFYPRVTWFNATKEGGDAYSLRATKPDLMRIQTADFIEHRPSRAIGGIQIVPGDVARRQGYCDGFPKLLRPVVDGQWKQTHEDSKYRSILGGKSLAIDVPSVYRIRQTQEGRVDTLAPQPPLHP